MLHLFGVMHHQCGYAPRALELIGRAIDLKPDVAAFHANLAEVYRALRQYDLAADRCRAALRLQPDFSAAHHNLGLTLHAIGRDEEALSHFDAALALQPDLAAAQNSRGTSLVALGRIDEAAEAFRIAIHLDPNLGDARANLGQTLTDQGKPAEALIHCQDAARVQPSLPAAHNSLGNALRALGSHDAARQAYAEAIRLDPNLAVAHANIGSTFQAEGEIDRALPHFKRAADLAPEDPSLQQRLAVAYSLGENWLGAIPCCEQRVRLDPDNADARSDLGFAYLMADWPIQAEAELLHALSLKPDHLDARLNLGMLQEQTGLLTEAEASYREAETRNPGSPLPLARLAVLLRGRLTGPDRDRLRFRLYEPIAPALRMSCLFAMAQVADAKGDFAEAAACAAPAHALARQASQSCGRRYDPDAHVRLIDQLIAHFNPELFDRLGSAGDLSDQPIFIFGMPRSGTTLVEQMLASHSRVWGAGELPLAREALDRLALSAPPQATIPAASDDVQPASITADGSLRMAGDYRSAVMSLFRRLQSEGEPARIVDKMPDNYICLGLIALMFPRATLIHIQRDLRDVAVSCWLTQFRSIPWTDTAEHLAGRCHEYRRLMKHWQAVLPRPIHEVRYEQLIEDFEPEARRLVKACGLDWEPACLQFHQTPRPVKTASVTQVRQPIYRRSVARWRHYEDHLADLFALLPEDGMVG